MSKIDTSSWKEFKLSELFEAERGRVKSLQKQAEGPTPVISAGASTEGITEYKDAITVSCNGACGATFYHPYEFNITGDACVLKCKYDLSENVKQYIACMLNGLLTRKYSYGDKCSPTKILDEVIKLPAIETYEPDWQYMEDYMRKIEEKVKATVDILEKARKIPEKKVDISKWGGIK